MFDFNSSRYLSADSRVYSDTTRYLAATGLPLPLHGQTAATLCDLVTAKQATWLVNAANSTTPIYLHDPSLIHAEFVAAALAHHIAEQKHRALWISEEDVYSELLKAMRDQTALGKDALHQLVTSGNLHTLFVIGLGQKVSTLRNVDWFGGEMGDFVTAALHAGVRLVITSPYALADLDQSGIDAVAIARITIALKRANVATPTIKVPRGYIPSAPEECMCPAHPVSLAAIRTAFPCLTQSQAEYFRLYGKMPEVLASLSAADLRTRNSDGYALPYVVNKEGDADFDAPLLLPAPQPRRLRDGKAALQQVIERDQAAMNANRYALLKDKLVMNFGDERQLSAGKESAS